MSTEPAEFSPAWFDATSAAWLQNKRKLGNGSYHYTCDHQYSTARRCGRDVYKTDQFCRQHGAIHRNQKFKAAMTGTNATKAALKPESPKSQ